MNFERRNEARRDDAGVLPNLFHLKIRQNNGGGRMKNSRLLDRFVC